MLVDFPIEQVARIATMRLRTIASATWLELTYRSEYETRLIVCCSCLLFYSVQKMRFQKKQFSEAGGKIQT